MFKTNTQCSGGQSFLLMFLFVCFCFLLNSNAYLALTVPVMLSSVVSMKDGSSTVTSNFGRTVDIEIG